MLEIKGISKKLGDFKIENLSFSVENGDYFMILGISGAGKSILLEIIAGLINLDKGGIYLEKTDITNQKIQERSVGLVFQDYAIFPHLNVFDNIAYPLRSKKIDKLRIKEKVNLLASEMNISHLLKRNPGTLSGGELQRVALARTLTLEPKILLLDEPLAALDIQLRSGLRGLLKKLNRKGQTILHVTHDYEEAVSLAKNVAVIYDGNIIQQGTPKDVFQNPQSEFVANFVGVKNFYKVSVSSGNENCYEGIINEKVSFFFLNGEGYKSGTIFLRGEDVIVSKNKLNSTALNNFEGVIKEVIPSRMGIELIIDVGVDISAHISNKSFTEMNLTEGVNVWVGFKASALRFIGIK